MNSTNFSAPAGLHVVVAHWTVAWSTHVRAHPHPATTGRATANAVLVLYA
ncbi:MAG: hypothetical protein L3K15_06900 [Thermoplasmata archaeon]|nr:hypothetical protein [Thermoplasmata archaeon]